MPKKKGVKEDGVVGPVTKGVIEHRVKHVQNFLNHVGYDIGDAGVDGILGHYTEHGIKQFQKKKNIIVDGIWGPKTEEQAVCCTKKLQTSLHFLGFYIGDSIDGHLGHYTINGIKHYQKWKGLVVDSIAGWVTRDHLHEDVKEIQTTVTHLGHGCGQIDGIYGDKTKAAVTLFQKDNGLKEDGICGHVTRGVMAHRTKHIQKFLHYVGYDIASHTVDGIDGHLGHYTVHGIEQFQKKKGLKVDGWWGPKTEEQAVICTKKLQTNLFHLGYYIGDAGIDGHLGHYTVSAVKRYQKDKGLVVDGVCGQITRQQMMDCVKCVQRTLHHLGHECDEIDGIFGTKTETAIKQYQKKKKGLKEDGICGPVTCGNLRHCVRHIQFSLIDFGYDIGDAGADGVLGHYTEHGIKQFQKDQGLTVDGIWGDKTHAKMADHVKEVQKALSDAKYYIGDAGVDGDFGHYTFHAVQHFQKDKGLTVDGIVGSKTRAVLFKK